MSEYSDSGIPYQFFFNGVELSKWSAHWHLCGLGEHLNGYEDDWDEFVSYRHIWHLRCRLDHVGITESEDPLIFRICAQEVLRVLLEKRDEMIRSIEESKESWPDQSVPAEEIYLGIAEGLVRMLQFCERDGFAFWTNGYANDGERLNDELRCYRLGETHPDYFAPPHVAQRRGEQKLRLGFQQNALRSLIASTDLPKEVTQLLNPFLFPTQKGGNEI